MKLSSIVFSIGAIAATAVSAVQNLQSSDGQLNISSPLENGVYVAGKILPLTYIPAVPSNLKLNVYLRGIDIAVNETVIANDADVSNSPENAIRNPVDNSVYYQHSINYDIPTTTPGGEYQVVFHNTNTNVNTSIPISIIAYTMPPNASNASSSAISLQPTVTATVINLSTPVQSATGTASVETI